MRRVPDGGIQPEAAIDSRGVLHLLYFAGEPAGGDLFYVRSNDLGATFSTPIRFNSQPGSAIATGKIRGGQLALGERRLHVAGTDRIARCLAAWSTRRKRAHRSYMHGPADGTGFEPSATSICTYRSMAAARSRRDAGRVRGVARQQEAAARRGSASGWLVRSQDGATFGRTAWDTPTGISCCQTRLCHVGERSCRCSDRQPHESRHLPADPRTNVSFGGSACSLVDQRCPYEHVPGGSRRARDGCLKPPDRYGVRRARAVPARRTCAGEGRKHRDARPQEVHAFVGRTGWARLDRLAGVRCHRPSVRADRIGPVASGLELRVGCRAP